MTTNTQQIPPSQLSFIKTYGHKLLALAFWLTLLGGYWRYTHSHNLTPLQTLDQLLNLLQGPIGPIIYIALYAIRPLIFFSAAILTVLSGTLFGTGSPWNLALAVSYVIIASNISSTLAYFVGRFFGKGVLEGSGEGEGIIQRYTNRMRENSFETVLIMRFIFVPYDLVSYLSGFLKVNYFSFILATILGSIPGTISFVAFGASINIIENGLTNPKLEPWALVTSLALFVGSLATSQFLKRREKIDNK